MDSQQKLKPQFIPDGIEQNLVLKQQDHAFRKVRIEKAIRILSRHNLQASNEKDIREGIDKLHLRYIELKANNLETYNTSPNKENQNDQETGITQSYNSKNDISNIENMQKIKAEQILKGDEMAGDLQQNMNYASVKDKIPHDVTHKIEYQDSYAKPMDSTHKLLDDILTLKRLFIYEKQYALKQSILAHLQTAIPSDVLFNASQETNSLTLHKYIIRMANLEKSFFMQNDTIKHERINFNASIVNAHKKLTTRRSMQLHRLESAYKQVHKLHESIKNGMRSRKEKDIIQFIKSMKITRCDVLNMFKNDRINAMKNYLENKVSTNKAIKTHLSNEPSHLEDKSTAYSDFLHLNRLLQSLEVHEIEDGIDSSRIMLTDSKWVDNALNEVMNGNTLFITPTTTLPYWEERINTHKNTILHESDTNHYNVVSIHDEATIDKDRIFQSVNIIINHLNYIPQNLTYSSNNNLFITYDCLAKEKQLLLTFPFARIIFDSSLVFSKVSTLLSTQFTPNSERILITSCDHFERSNINELWSINKFLFPSSVLFNANTFYSYINQPLNFANITVEINNEDKIICRDILLESNRVYFGMNNVNSRLNNKQSISENIKIETNAYENITENITKDTRKENIAKDTLKENITKDQLNENIAKDQLNENIAKDQLNENIAKDQLNEHISKDTLKENIAKDTLKENIANNILNENVTKNTLYDNKKTVKMTYDSITNTNATYDEQINLLLLCHSSQLQLTLKREIESIFYYNLNRRSRDRRLYSSNIVKNELIHKLNSNNNCIRELKKNAIHPFLIDNVKEHLRNDFQLSCNKNEGVGEDLMGTIDLSGKFFVLYNIIKTLKTGVKIQGLSKEEFLWITNEDPTGVESLLENVEFSELQHAGLIIHFKNVNIRLIAQGTIDEFEYLLLKYYEPFNVSSVDLTREFDLYYKDFIDTYAYNTEGKIDEPENIYNDIEVKHLTGRNPIQVDLIHAQTQLEHTKDTKISLQQVLNMIKGISFKPSIDNFVNFLNEPQIEEPVAHKKVKKTPNIISSKDNMKALIEHICSLEIDDRSRINLFIELPDKQDYQDYYAIIKNPISIEIIEEKLENDSYRGISYLKRDLIRMCNNAMNYNEEGSEVYEDAVCIKAEVEKY